jgi:secreted trypsin-like serine protease
VISFSCLGSYLGPRSDGNCMRISVAAAILLAALPSALAQTPDAGCRTSRKIVGGSIADPADWPGFAALRLYHIDSKISLQFCGATAITPDWLVTAAHCFDSLQAQWQALVSQTDDFARVRIEALIGVATLDAVTDQNVYQVTQTIQHEVYATAFADARKTSLALAAGTAERIGHDIALVRLARPWNGPWARLTLTETSPSAGSTAPPANFIVAGFGATSPNGGDIKRFTRSNGEKFLASTPELLEVTLPLVSENRCKAAWPQAVIGGGQLCAGFDRPVGKDSCNGDSGGPLVTLDDKLCPSQIGLVSWGPSPCAPGKQAFGVYTRLSAFSDWIKSKVSGLP